MGVNGLSIRVSERIILTVFRLSASQRDPNLSEPSQADDAPTDPQRHSLPPPQEFR